MQTITKQEFEKKVQNDAKIVHNRYLRMGVFWPLSVCATEVRRKLITQYKIAK